MSKPLERPCRPRVIRLSDLVLLSLLGIGTGASAESAPTVTILNEGYVAPIEGRAFEPGESPDGARRVASTVALIEADGALIVADPGMVGESVDLLDELSSRGHEPDDVTHVFISHHHPDHTVRVGLFPDAELIDFQGRYVDDLWSDHPDPYEFAPGVSVIATPGHSDEDASLVVETAGATWVLTHLWWNERMEPIVDPLAADQEALEASRERVLEFADVIVPGHGRAFDVPERD